MPYLRTGSSGNAVKLWQELLATVAASGVGVTPGAIDGQFGPMTENSTRKFQEQTAALIDGIVGPETAGKMIEIVSDNRELLEKARAVRVFISEGITSRRVAHTAPPAPADVSDSTAARVPWVRIGILAAIFAGAGILSYQKKGGK